MKQMVKSGVDPGMMNHYEIIGRAMVRKENTESLTVFIS